MYFRLKDGVIAQTLEYPKAREVFFDLNEQGQLIGIEVLEPGSLDMQLVFRDIAETYEIQDFSSLIDKPISELAA
ncbi:TPA: DUF2283 domain-containing protein [Candidatus Poribacteria bacterium]|nr:DUF2283 domain-containing protein [Candidatus Poribacteria bacterium]